jgi:hypothetical protein
MAIVDGTVAGDGAGPRTMIPKIKNTILAGYDQVSVDAVVAKIMGFEPMEFPFIKIAHDEGLGCGDIDQIEIVDPNGNEVDISHIDWKFSVGRSPVVWGDQQVRKGKLKFLEPLMHTWLFEIGPVQMSAVYHDFFWINTIGAKRIRDYNKTNWGKLFKEYRTENSVGETLNIIRKE